MPKDKKVCTSESNPIFVNFVEDAPNWPQEYGKIGYVEKYTTI